jgi:hypothetical protein
MLYLLMFFGDPSFFSAPVRPISPDPRRLLLSTLALLRFPSRGRLRARASQPLPANHGLAHKPRVMSTCTKPVPTFPEINTCVWLNLNPSRMNTCEKSTGRGILSGCKSLLSTRRVRATPAPIPLQGAHAFSRALTLQLDCELPAARQGPQNEHLRKNMPGPAGPARKSLPTG